MSVETLQAIHDAMQKKLDKIMVGNIPEPSAEPQSLTEYHLTAAKVGGSLHYIGEEQEPVIVVNGIPGKVAFLLPRQDKAFICDLPKWYLDIRAIKSLTKV